MCFPPIDARFIVKKQVSMHMWYSKMRRELYRHWKGKVYFSELHDVLPENKSFRCWDENRVHYMKDLARQGIHVPL